VRGGARGLNHYVVQAGPVLDEQVERRRGRAFFDVAVDLKAPERGRVEEMCVWCGAICLIALFAALSDQERSARRTTRATVPYMRSQSDLNINFVRHPAIARAGPGVAGRASCDLIGRFIIHVRFTALEISPT
jgi:hypothetical protein